MPSAVMFGTPAGLREDGSAVCWGNDEWGRATPPEGETFSAISSGDLSHLRIAGGRLDCVLGRSPGSNSSVILGPVPDSPGTLGN